MLLANFLLRNVASGLYLALLLAVIKFFVYAEHTGEQSFIGWWILGFMLSVVWKLLEAAEIYKKLKELEQNDY